MKQDFYFISTLFALTMKEKYTNHLIHETSAYLLQHAHNPVNWYAWGEEAIKKAKEEDKPILVSIGYSACHWCHVMEKESFENEETAELMNRWFINIKIDREERPDLDHIYMDAVQTIAGSGGWPLNVFLTPDLKPFYGGTYFPPATAFNRSSWKQVITAVATAYQTKKNEIEQQAQQLTEHLFTISNFEGSNAEQQALNDDLLKEIADNLLKNADADWGGFGNAPKFPQTFSIMFLLRHYYFTGDTLALKQAITSLDKMMMGGMYDHLGGGFARYSTDRRWQIPHFEKMLYDNALLIDVFTEAYQLTKNTAYADVVNETIQFIKNEMTSSGGGFYSALDADSEGVEGKYYVWSKKEIDDLLGEDSQVFSEVYNVSETGNWEHTNILWMPEGLEIAAAKFSLTMHDLKNLLKKCRKILLNERQKRVRPLLDEKVICGWNALMTKSSCKAYSAFGNEEYLNLAEQNISFLEKNLKSEDNNFHSWNKILNKQEAFLDDYAALIQAYILMSEVKAKDEYLQKAKNLTDKVINDFSDETNLFFYFTSHRQTDVILRKKEIYDGATPSGNALMAENLFLLSVFFDNNTWRQRSAKMMENIKDFTQKHPLTFDYWTLNLQSFIKGLKEVVITGDDYFNFLHKILKEYIPVKIIQSSKKHSSNWPLLKHKTFSNGSYIYLCENYNCLKPAKTFEDFQIQVNQNIFIKNSSATK